jgi:hypothetical protein
VKKEDAHNNQQSRQHTSCTPNWSLEFEFVQSTQKEQVMHNMFVFLKKQRGKNVPPCSCKFLIGW